MSAPKTFDEMQSIHHKSILENTLEVAKLCNVFLEEGQYYLPTYEIDSDKSLSEHLEFIAKEKLNELLSSDESLDKNEYQDRLEKELKIIIEVIISMLRRIYKDTNFLLSINLITFQP